MFQHNRIRTIEIRGKSVTHIANHVFMDRGNKKTISNICVTFFDISGLAYALPGIHAACVLVERRELTRESIQPARNLFHIWALSRRQLFQWISYSAPVNFELPESNAHEIAEFFFLCHLSRRRYQVIS